MLARLLFPKMRKRSGRLGGKGAPGSARAAVLSYFAQLEPAELAPVVQLFLLPLGGCMVSDGTASQAGRSDSAAG